MLLTIFISNKNKEILPTFEELLQNPFLTIEQNTTELQIKKKTIEITEDYGLNLFNRRIENNPYQMLLNSIPYTEIPTEEIPNHYRRYTIPKKTNPNKKRIIEEPDEYLRVIQDFHKTMIADNLKIQVHDAAFAYVKNRDILKSTKRHQENQSKWFLKLDLKDFFPSINEKFLRNQLDMVYPFKFLPKIFMDNLIKYALLNDSLPQGTTISPLLSNLVMVPIDYEITNLLMNYNKHHYVYTRYADDIEVSCKEKFNPRDITNELNQIFRKYEAPFEINTEKTTFGNSAGSNYHLGLNLNKNNTISKGYEKNNKFRVMLYQFAKNPAAYDYNELNRIAGIIAHFKYIEPEFVRKSIAKYNTKCNINIEQEIKRRLSCPVLD
jgi:RNA-directed DNA polymerase